MATKVETIEKFDADVCKSLRPIMEKALNEALKQSGLNATLGNIRFTDTSFETKVEVKAANDDRTRYELYSQLHGLKKEWFGQPFTNQGETLRISGWNEGRKSSTHPVQVTNEKGQTFVLTVQAIKNAFLEPAEAAKEHEATLRRNWQFGYWEHGLSEHWLGQELKGGRDKMTIAGLEKIRRKTYVALKKPNNTIVHLELNSFLAAAGAEANKHLKQLQKTA